MMKQAEKALLVPFTTGMQLPLVNYAIQDGMVLYGRLRKRCLLYYLERPALFLVTTVIFKPS
jgi:hypothetical protein